MCGLLGYSGVKPFDPIKMKLLFLYNEDRGVHSAGFYNELSDVEFEHRIRKKIGKVRAGFCSEGSDLFTPSTLFLGHTRQSTKTGSQSNLNCAHPFHFGNIIGAHNGSFYNDTPLIERYELDKKIVDLDSKVIFSYIDKFKDYKILTKVGGGTAVLYVNKDNPGVLNCFRNFKEENNYHRTAAKHTRPLFRGNMVIDGVFHGMYISSLKESLSAIGCTDIKEFKANCHYTVKEGKIATTVANLKPEPYDYQEHKKWKDAETAKLIAESKDKKEATAKIHRDEALINGDDKSYSGDMGTPTKKVLRVDVSEEEVIENNATYVVTKFNDGTERKVNKYYFRKNEVVWEDTMYLEEVQAICHVLYYSCGGYEQIRVDGDFLKGQKKPVATQTSLILHPNSEENAAMINMGTECFQIHSLLTEEIDNLKEKYRLHVGIESKELSFKPLETILEEFKESLAPAMALIN